jgi:hypothetical protein
VLFEYTRQDSNLQPSVPKTDALSIELRVRGINRSGFAGRSTAEARQGRSGTGRRRFRRVFLSLEVRPGGR